MVAYDAAGNASAPSTGSTATTLTPDTTPPSVSITMPASNATVSSTVTVSATATDNVAVNDVRFQLDGVNLGADLTASPYTIQWDTTTATNGTHLLTAIANDTSGNSATSSAITVTVNNTVTGPPIQGLIGYWNFDEGAGTIAHDTSGSGYNATVNGATWVTGKINGALSFNGASNAVTSNIALGNTFSISAWVNPICNAAEHLSFGSSRRSITVASIWARTGPVRSINSSSTRRPERLGTAAQPMVAPRAGRSLPGGIW